MEANGTDKQMPDLSGLIGTVLSNPAALGALASLLGNLGSATPPAKEASAPPFKTVDSGETATTSALPTYSGFAPHPPRIEDARRQTLLSALRPYLRKEQCEMLDKLLGLYEVFSLFSSKRR